MPELPELEVIRDNLHMHLGKTVRDFKVLKPYIMRSVFYGTLSGEKVEGIHRFGKFLELGLTLHKIIVHLMVHGVMKSVKPGTKSKKTAGAMLTFTDGSGVEFAETGSKKRMAVYVLAKSENLDKIERLGADPLENDFTCARLGGMLKKNARQMKSFLCDQREITGIGNAYADEILWQARLSPFKITNTLSDAEIIDLHSVIVYVLKWAISMVKNNGVNEKRSFLMVHNKKNKPCPRCGAQIRSVSFADKETYYCPSCQTRDRVLKDRRMSRFYR